MMLVHSKPWQLFDRLQDEFNRHNGLEEAGRDGALRVHWQPDVDVKEEADSYVLRADLPGMAREDISVSQARGLLTIEGDRRAENSESKEGYHRVERSYGHFARRFRLPDTASAEDIAAKYQDGVLEVRVPKSEQAQPRQIEVQA